MADCPDIAGVLVDTWRSTFRGILSDAFLDGLSERRQIERYEKFLGKPDVRCAVSLNANGRIIGFCCGGPNRSTSVDVPAEIYALYVRRDEQRCGVGERLLRSVGHSLAVSMGAGLLVWVIESNPARSFYRHMGGREILRETLTLGTEDVIQVAYVWYDALTGNAAPADRIGESTLTERARRSRSDGAPPR